MKELKVCLFNYPSTRRTLQLTLPPASLFSPELLIGRVVFVDWPSLHRARVVRIEDRRCITETKVNYSDEPSYKALTCQAHHVSKQTLTSQEWSNKVQQTARLLREKKGIEVGLVEVLVTVKKINGALRLGLDHFVERYGGNETYPLQVNRAHAPPSAVTSLNDHLMLCLQAVMLENVYPNHPVDLGDEQKLTLCPHDRLLYIGEDYPGTVATVLDDEDSPTEASSLKGTFFLSDPLSDRSVRRRRGGSLFKGERILSCLAPNACFLCYVCSQICPETVEKHI